MFGPHLPAQLDPPLYAHLEARECLSFFYCYRWLLIWMKREFPFEEARQGGGACFEMRLFMHWHGMAGSRHALALHAGEQTRFLCTEPADCRHNSKAACTTQPSSRASIPFPPVTLPRRPSRCCACGRRCGRACPACTSTSAWPCWSTTAAKSSGACGHFSVGCHLAGGGCSCRRQLRYAGRKQIGMIPGERLCPQCVLASPCPRRLP